MFSRDEIIRMVAATRTDVNRMRAALAEIEQAYDVVTTPDAAANVAHALELLMTVNQKLTTTVAVLGGRP